MEELLVETWGQPSTVTDITSNTLSESNINGLSPGLYIEGVFLQAEVINGNNRVYPKRVLEVAVDRYIREQVNTRQALGELNHPPRNYVDPDKAALIIEKLWWEGNNVMGRARIIENDNGPGDKLAANIRAGWIPGVSSRGLGSLRESNGHKVVQEGFRLTVGVDAVWGPSAPDAHVKPIQVNESTNTPKSVPSTKNNQAISLLSHLTEINGMYK